MKKLPHILSLVIIGCILFACASSPNKVSSNEKEEPVVIKNDSLEYEIIIIDPGFTNFLNTAARPVGFYSQTYLENRNRLLVPVWNYRVQTPSQFNPNIYENIINYQPTINYGYDVNYKLYNYFVFAQRKYNMNLGVFGSTLPR